MKILKRKFLLLTIAAIILSLAFAVIVNQPLMLNFINSYFMIGLLYLTAGALLYVIGGGFFNIFSYSFKKFWKVNSKKENYIAEMEEIEDSVKHKGPNMEVISFSWTRPLIFSGLLSFVITFGCSIIFYM